MSRLEDAALTMIDAIRGKHEAYQDTITAYYREVRADVLTDVGLQVEHMLTQLDPVPDSIRVFAEWFLDGLDAMRVEA